MTKTKNGKYVVHMTTLKPGSREFRSSGAQDISYRVIMHLNTSVMKYWSRVEQEELLSGICTIVQIRSRMFPEDRVVMCKFSGESIAGTDFSEFCDTKDRKGRDLRLSDEIDEAIDKEAIRAINEYIEKEET